MQLAPYGQALLDYQNGVATEDIQTHSSIAGKDTMPLDYLFRQFKSMPKIEQKTLNLCSGKVLDIGCGSGSHSLYLQQKGFDVLGIDISKGAVEVCKLRGLEQVYKLDFWQIKNQKYDTLLLLMNGIGLCGTLDKLPSFLKHLKKLLKPNGQILVDSSDIIYMYENEEGNFDVPEDTYYGEVQFSLSYKGSKSKPFDWLYLDFERLKLNAKKVGLQCEIIENGPHFDYLAKLYV